MRTEKIFNAYLVDEALGDDHPARLTEAKTRAEMTPIHRHIRVQVMMPVEEMKAINDWRFEHRLPTRAAAVRELMRRGMMMSR